MKVQSTSPISTQVSYSLDDVWQRYWFYEGIEHLCYTLPIYLKNQKGTKRIDAVKKVLEVYKDDVIKHMYDEPTGRFAYKGKELRLWSWNESDELTVVASDNEALAKFCEKLSEFFTRETVTGRYASVNEIFMTSNGLEFHQTKIPVDRVPKIYPELYPNIDIDKLLDEYLSSPEGILILYGDPGVGKTCFMKYLMISKKITGSVIYVKDERALHSPELWSMIASSGADVVILDDLDDCLQPREEQDHGGFLGKMLSATDGIFPSDTKYVISTNQKISSIDPAVIRPGRCFDFLHLEAMTREEAKEFWKFMGLPENQFDKSFQSESVSQAALMSEIGRLDRGFKERTYIKKGNKKYSVQDKITKLGISTKKRTMGLGIR